MDMGPMEIALIVLAIVLIFGVGKLGDIGGALGKSIREFRQERDKTDALPTTAEDTKNSESVPTREDEPTKRGLCPACGEAAHERAIFCMKCGAKLESQSCGWVQKPEVTHTNPLT